jgi:catechol 2,3-dioxygenase-like lactoylglutathione lyase family enzyme
VEEAEMMSPIIKGVSEIVINVRDLSGLKQFYEHVLGFRFHSQYPDTEPTIVFLTISAIDTPLGYGGHPQLFALIDVKRDPHTKTTYSDLDNRRSALNHLAFEIDTSAFLSEKQRLEELGLSGENHDFHHMQAKGLFFHDSEDNMVELICHNAVAYIKGAT